MNPIGMKVTHYKMDGKVFRQIVSSTYTPLRELRDQYERQGRKTWINPYMLASWSLTVEIGTTNEPSVADRYRFGWFVEQEPSLERTNYSTLEGPYFDFLGHINSHSKSNPSYERVLSYCVFCQILNRVEKGVLK